jgi:hypothetical protein
VRYFGDITDSKASKNLLLIAYIKSMDNAIAQRQVTASYFAPLMMGSLVPVRCSVLFGTTAACPHPGVDQ